MVSCTLEEAPRSPLEIGNTNGRANDSGGSSNNVRRCNDGGGAGLDVTSSGSNREEVVFVRKRFVREVDT
ncbi:hypothetical protein Ancab_005136 [Ancistrocladus abbreviatus]